MSNAAEYQPANVSKSYAMDSSALPSAARGGTRRHRRDRMNTDKQRNPPTPIH